MDEETGKILQRDFEEQKSRDRIKRQERVHLHSICLHTLQWHHPGGRALLQLAQAPTQDYHSYTHTLLGVVEEHVVGPSDPPVKKTREHSAAKQLWPNRGRHNAFPLLGLGGKRCSFCVHGADVDEVGLPALPKAEAELLVCVICALV